MANEWYCRIMGDEWGPMSAEELMAVARWGRLTRDDVVRCGTSGTWVRAELVRGLFNSYPSAATIKSLNRGTVANGAAPAKRSVRSFVPTRYWVKIGQIGSKAAGPFSARQIRQFAEQGVLKPNHLVSNDRQHWSQAANIQGLVFGDGTAGTGSASARTAMSMDESQISPNTPTAEGGCYVSGVEIPIQVGP